MRRQIFILNSFIFIHKIDKLYHILYTLIKKLLANDDDNGLSITDTATATLKAQSSKTKMLNNNDERSNRMVILSLLVISNIMTNQTFPSPKKLLNHHV
mmetsp:Transcript_51102/g.51519  ORF Transcript_51102/g.51519 Transcript_51102/m.51519 type:complete len:99 (+) Transcript_51102:21-317(+)